MVQQPYAGEPPLPPPYAQPPPPPPSSGASGSGPPVAVYMYWTPRQLVEYLASIPTTPRDVLTELRGNPVIYGKHFMAFKRSDMPGGSIARLVDWLIYRLIGWLNG